jgi:hypothetical protein
MSSLPVTSVSSAECSCRQSLTRFLGANINMAIKACSPEKGQLLHHLNHMEVIKEFLNDGYCDVSGQVDNLKLVGELGVSLHGKQRETIKVFATEGMLIEPRSYLDGMDHDLV